MVFWGAPTAAYRFYPSPATAATGPKRPLLSELTQQFNRLQVLVGTGLTGQHLQMG